MAQVVVVGGGFAGLSAAARLAKLRHHVTLLESSDQLGGRLRGVERDGVLWQTSLDTVTLPGVFRDLFRKSGRPLEQVLGLEKTDGRRHVFADKSVLDLPLGNRGDQHEAIVAAWGEDAWSPWVDGWADTWDVIRRTALDQPFAGRSAVDRSMRRSLHVRRSLATLARKDFDDPRLAKMVLTEARLAGQERLSTPAFVAAGHYVERNFGRWRFEGGLPALADALVERLDQRGVVVQTSTFAQDLDLRDGRVAGVITDTDVVPADIVLWCAPHWPAALPRPRGMPTIPSTRTYLVLGDDAPDLALDTVVHTNPPMRLWSTDGTAWTIEHHSGGEDPLIALVRAGIDLRDHIVERWDQTPSDLVRSGAHWGWSWQGWTTAFDRPGFDTFPGVHLAGAHAHPGGSLEAIGMATAAIADRIGPVPRH